MYKANFSNVFVGEPPYPVLVYIPNEIIGQHYEAIELVAKEKVLVVTVNSRASPSGKLHSLSASIHFTDTFVKNIKFSRLQSNFKEFGYFIEKGCVITVN